MKKAALLLVLAFIATTLLSACSSGNPTDVVDKYLKASNKLDGKEGDKYTCKNTSKEFDGIQSMEITNIQITKEKEDGNKAEVRATGHMKATRDDGVTATDSDFNLLFKLKKGTLQPWCIDDMVQE
jgi:hypothetical protein